MEEIPKGGSGGTPAKSTGTNNWIGKLCKGKDPRMGGGEGRLALGRGG